MRWLALMVLALVVNCGWDECRYLGQVAEFELHNGGVGSNTRFVVTLTDGSKWTAYSSDNSAATGQYLYRCTGDGRTMNLLSWNAPASVESAGTVGQQAK